MEQPFSFLHATTTKLSPVEAEVEIALVTNRSEKNLEFTGRLVGPRCCYNSTVEVSYPFRSVAGSAGSMILGLKTGLKEFYRRVVIPEPSQWEPQTPFLYEGFAQLLHEGLELQRWPIHHGLRKLQLRPNGLWLNGHPFLLRGLCRTELSQSDIFNLNRLGVNAILTPMAFGDLWDQGDRYGFLLVGEVKADPSSLREIYSKKAHPSCALFLFPEDTSDGLISNHDLFTFLGLTKFMPLMRENPYQLPAANAMFSLINCVAGLRLNRPPRAPLPNWVSFVACSEELWPELTEINLPKLLLYRGDIPETLPNNFGPLLGAISLTQ